MSKGRTYTLVAGDVRKMMAEYINPIGGLIFFSLAGFLILPVPQLHLQMSSVSL
jgi:hypothetical protein